MKPDYIKEAYERLKKKLGRQPSQDDFYENTTVTAYHLLKAGFRTYSKLVEEMGDTPRSFFHGGKTEEHFLISYGNTVRQLNRIPSTTDWVFNKCTPVISSYKKKFKLKNWKQMSSIFFDYAKDKTEWKDVVELIPADDNTPLPIQRIKSEECYVYFMLDTKNLLYKIGISNLPEWREKTLQSERPSVKLIAAKRVVNRRIAANLEKALHDSYSHKRKRGEWFQFDQEDVDEIKAMLAE